MISTAELTRDGLKAALERRHQELEQEIRDAEKHPSTDHLAIVELKRRKLLVKEEIASLAR